jgi:sorbitol/mannitol transport system substrate-binding protein
MQRTRAILAAGLCAVLVASGCSGAGGGADSSGGGQTITVATVGNPQMQDIEKLTKEGFTDKTGITVKYNILPENELRDKVTQDVATQGGQYDVVTIGAYETPIWAKNGWLVGLDERADDDSAYDKADLLEPMRKALSFEDKLYAVPFYGESSFLMYRKDLFQAKGITMPEQPTWAQVAQYAAQLDQGGTAGICLRGLPGWGEVFAPLTTVVNTFGGTWFDEDWNAKVNSPEFTAATKFYVDLVRNHGEPGAPNSGFSECLTAFSQGKAAMWYDATVAAGSLEDPKVSTVAGKVGYVTAPVNKTKSSGWLWAWALAMPKTSKKQDAAWKYMAWATGKEYQKLVGEKLGWSRVPPGARASTYEIPEYKEAAKAFADVTLKAIEQVDPDNPGVQPRPAPGVQFVGIPEFADLGTKVSQQVSAAIAGRTTVDAALAAGQKEAEAVAKKYRK